jgi:hypothetical protein
MGENKIRVTAGSFKMIAETNEDDGFEVTIVVEQ